MDRVFVDSTSPCDLADSWFASYDHTQLYTVLTQAAIRASHTGQATLVSLVLPIRDVDALHVFRAFQELYPGECFYWEQPAQHVALTGASTALTIETSGSGRFVDAARSWKQLRDEAITYNLTGDATNVSHGPVLFGGFRFDQQNPSSSLWKAFPAGLLLLPRLLFTRRAEQTTLTFSQLIRATDNLDNLASKLNAEFARLAQCLNSLHSLLEASMSKNTPEIEQIYTTRDIWPAETWKGLVAHTVQAIQQGAYAKIVLAREVEVTAGQRRFSLPATLQNLRQSYPGANIFAFQRGEHAFIGATPERLVHAHNGSLHTMALAGSAPRGTTEAEDNRLGDELLHSSKNRQEHEIVTSTVREALANLCSSIWVAHTPQLLRLKNIQHLQTPIVGELLPGHNLLETLAALHPTPAVGGSPTRPALAFIREHEHLDRGWYAGPIGWIDLEGNGEFAVALRSALLETGQARLFAGCGIVADSDPEAEYAESCLKLLVILRCLSGEE